MSDVPDSPTPSLSFDVDLSDPVQVRSALHLSEQRLRLALEAAREGLWDWDLEHRRAYFSPSYYTMLGYRSGDFSSDFESWQSLVHPEDLPLVLGDLTELAQQGGHQFMRKYRLRNSSGEWRWVLGRGLVAERDAGGRPVRLVGLTIDVTDQTAAETALQESEARFRAIFDNIQEGILIHDIDTGAILSTNLRACEMFGMMESDLLAASMEDLSSGAPPYTQADAAYWMMRAAAGDSQSFEWQARASDGRLFWVEITMRKAVLGGHERLLAVVRDISNRKLREAEINENLERQVQLNKKLEEAHNQLLQSEKMASIGQLAAGVAHELNNPIGFVHSNIGTLEAYLADLFAIIDGYGAADDIGECVGAKFDAVRKLKADKDYEYIKTDVAQLMAESKDGLVRVRKIVQDLKDFSRVGEAEWQWADLHKGIDSTLNIVWNELKYKCKVHKEYGELPEVHCLPSQLNQVFMNLLVNAGQAIENQGDITIRTGREEDRVWVEVADTGSGIPKENLTRIFEPFFTTKPVGKGTGLGLSLSYSIVLKHHGKIEVKSVVGKGTTFHVTLPIDPALEQPPAPPAATT
ncbi:MAG TPA: PAS domain S-box protein [Rhodocyclaceae bacterium]|nr:PAS domain S-box protein [Rhodocyclaceae bacterium]